MARPLLRICSPAYASHDLLSDCKKRPKHRFSEPSQKQICQSFVYDLLYHQLISPAKLESARSAAVLLYLISVKLAAICCFCYMMKGHWQALKKDSLSTMTSSIPNFSAMPKRCSTPSTLLLAFLKGFQKSESTLFSMNGSTSKQSAQTLHKLRRRS